jgi:NET1-associated nuclear protein 1 (U3 small nucleolar RNA-associated protein 17)
VARDDGDKPVVRPQQLAEIFDVAPSFALPTVQELFHAVARLYAQKPPVRAAAVGT